MSTLLRRLATAAYKHPEHFAVEWDGGELTYSALWELAREVERSILTALEGSTPSVVAVSSVRSPTTVATFLACLSRAWTYVPVPETPTRRVEQVLASAHAQVLVRAGTSGTAWDVEVVGGNGRPDAVAPACILHTSGSTGTPKGVTITADNLDAFVAWCIDTVPLVADDRVASLSPFHFDLCTHDIYATLSQGATLVLPGPDVESSPQHALAFVAGRGITRLYMVPTFLERLSRAGAKRDLQATDVTTVMFAGERLQPSARPRIESVFPRASLWNLYGPIETNVITAAPLRRGEEHDSSRLGRALPGVRLAVRQPDGVVLDTGRGELLAAGRSVTPGYVGAVADRFVDHDGDRFYATGDEVDIDLEGRVVLHGRLDNMVKIRGLRVELEEVEQAIGSTRSVQAVGVTPTPDGLSLAAHVQADSDDALADASRSCREQLPAYMVPTVWRRVDVMPTTPSGKVDRRRLQASLQTQGAER